jgi:hypothetical protein
MAGSCENGNEPSVSVKGKISWLAERTVIFSRSLCSMELLSYCTESCQENLILDLVGSI